MTVQEIEPRHGMPSPKLSQDEFRRRYLQQFVDTAYDRIRPQLDQAADIAWEAYQAGRKAPLTRKAGSEAVARLAECACRDPGRATTAR